ncbi:MAG: Spore protein SP21 [Candidatus Omnitrophica bacterium ADurb.Bin292]|jgi:HSP20 family protein|nr:MAG: Spore protein SP21 [Candidatus Omnitrophica bacterium ADurb.Bin292]HOG23149.1 Hsp20/alpha crystallin family protein [Candidatus Omnitrophota bacterium]HPW76798.1 Hsp20/alpha crystallin family protein [Candidatus Omnitrophota bacterium]HQB11633.1 Hsp20/alpha crystallin family protein [Candidatus Omnitrophota bacterium]
MNHLIRKENQWMDPFDMLADLHGNINRLLSSSLRRGSQENISSFAPSLDLREKDDRFVVRADVPGIDKKDIDISVIGNTLMIKGERKSEERQDEKGYYYTERVFGTFHRSVELPVEVDSEKVTASYKDGVLEVTVPKSERAKPKQIKVDIK